MVELQTRSAALGPLMKRLGAWLAALGVEEFIARSTDAAEHAFALRKAAEGAEFQMSEAEESLAAELAPSGSLAWQRLHGDVSSQLIVEVAGRRRSRAGADGDGARPRDPSRRGAPPAPRTKASSRRGRRWRCRSPPRSTAPRASSRCSTAGAVSSTTSSRTLRREQRRPRAPLDAMTEAVVDVAARLPPLPPGQGAGCSATTTGLPWWDLFAPVGDRPASVVGPRHRRSCATRSAASRPSSPGSPTRAFAERWVDAEIRDGKRGGAYCAPVDERRQPRDDELRRQPRFGVDARARARPRLPQRRARGAHADAAALADGARRDRVDLLRDAAVRELRRHRGAPTTRASGDPRHLPRRRVAGRRRHPQPVPVRDRAVPAPPPHERCRSRSSTR